MSSLVDVDRCAGRLKLLVTRVLDKIPTEDIISKDSSESKLQIDFICSVRFFTSLKVINLVFVVSFVSRLSLGVEGAEPNRTRGEVTRADDRDETLNFTRF